MTDVRKHFTMQLTEDGETYPFVEDENANITGYGHQDRSAFVAAIARYDAAAEGIDYDPAEAAWDEDYVVHRWVREHPENDELLQVCREGDPGAFPVTVLWGQR